ncbi:MAG: metallophosphoesterase [Deltaproteobacteria bacterium]|nr:metallophosphoesterase [Deltaproteobacteria bacterium]
MALFGQRKIKLVISDFHLGKGARLPDGGRNLLEDFTSEKQLIDFLNYYMSGDYKKAQVELIINGDFFNLLQIDYKESFTTFITQDNSLYKMKKILEGHPYIFAKLSEFSQVHGHKITFILGNHDPGLLWPAVQRQVKEHLKGEVYFEMEVYKKERIHVEHGNQHLADNRYDKENYFLTEGLKEPIINLPFGSFVVIQYLSRLKKYRPYVDKVYPFRLYLRWALIHDTLFALKWTFKLVTWFLAFVFVKNPAHQFSWKHLLQILKETTVHPKLHREARKILEEDPNTNIVVFGHTHQHLHHNYGKGKDYFNSGTWNERISLDVGSLGRSLRLTFVYIEYDKNEIPHGVLMEWKGHTNPVEEVIW